VEVGLSPWDLSLGNFASQLSLEQGGSLLYDNHGNPYRAVLLADNWALSGGATGAIGSFGGDFNAGYVVATDPKGVAGMSSYTSVGPAAGFILSAGISLVRTTGNLQTFRGVTENLNVSLPGIGFTLIFDNNTRNLIGGSIGFGKGLGISLSWTTTRFLYTKEFRRARDP